MELSKKVELKVVSDSMMPLIPIGAMLEVEPSEDYELFDIVLFKVKDKMYCHYIWKINSKIDKDYLVTRSLKTAEEDFPIHQNQILGVVRNFRIGKLKRAMLLLERALCK